jgi:hypothetical protein
MDGVVVSGIFITIVLFILPSAGLLLYSVWYIKATSFTCYSHLQASFIRISTTLLNSQIMHDVHNEFNEILPTATFEVLTATSMKTAVFWVAATCSLVEVYHRFRGTCCLHHQGDG